MRVQIDPTDVIHRAAMGSVVDGMKRPQIKSAHKNRTRVSIARELAVTVLESPSLLASRIRDAMATSPVGRYRPVWARHQRRVARPTAIFWPKETIIRCQPRGSKKFAKVVATAAVRIHLKFIERSKDLRPSPCCLPTRMRITAVAMTTAHWRATLANCLQLLTIPRVVAP